MQPSPVAAVAVARSEQLVAVGRESSHVEIWDAQAGFAQILVRTLSSLT